MKCINDLQKSSWFLCKVNRCHALHSQLDLRSVLKHFFFGFHFEIESETDYRFEDVVKFRIPIIFESPYLTGLPLQHHLPSFIEDGGPPMTLSVWDEGIEDVLGVAVVILQITLGTEPLVGGSIKSYLLLAFFIGTSGVKERGIIVVFYELNRCNRRKKTLRFPFLPLRLPLRIPQARCRRVSSSMTFPAWRSQWSQSTMNCS